MKIDQLQHFYSENQHILQNSEQTTDHVHIDMDIALQSDTLIEFQKDIFNEFFAYLNDQIQQLGKKQTQKNIKKVFEATLQELNSKLAIFSSKMDKVDYFPIKGSIKIIVDNTMMASLIGNVSLMIFRQEKLFYAINNDYKPSGKVDFFSEFVEGEIQTQDEIITIGNDIYTVFDKKEIKRFNDVFISQGEDISAFLEETISMRIEKEQIGFIIKSVYDLDQHKNKHTGKSSHTASKPQLSSYMKKNKFLVSISFLGFIIVILVVNVLKGSSIVSYPEYVDEYGETVTITPDSIKKDIAYFQKLDPSSDEKSYMYRDIVEQLDYIQSQGYWPEDIDNRRRILEKHYNKGFNIIYETSLNNFDDELNGTRAQIIEFTQDERNAIGTPHTLVANNTVSVAGSAGAMIGIVNEDVRGSQVNNTEEEPFLGCTANILRDGMYCYNENGNIYNLGKAGMTAVTTESPGGFPGNIIGLDIFAKTNFYILNDTAFLNQEGIYISRYRNVLGSQTEFQSATDYILPVTSGSSFPTVSSFAIDGTFIVRTPEKKSLQQRRREGTSLTLNARDIEIIGGDVAQQSRSENIKILTNINTRYIHIFDRDNQTLTVFDTRGLKTNDANTTSFSLQYIMQFKFALETDTIIDMAINENDGNQTNLFILTNNGLYKIKLFEFIQEVINNETSTSNPNV